MFSNSSSKLISPVTIPGTIIMSEDSNSTCEKSESLGDVSEELLLT